MLTNMLSHRSPGEVLAMAKRVAAAISVSPGAIPLEISVRAIDEARVTIQVTGRVPERDAGHPTNVYHVNVFEPYCFEGPDEDLAACIAGEIFHIVRRAYLHECEEAFKVAGIRVFDPHAGEDGQPRDQHGKMLQAIRLILGAPPAEKEILAPGSDPA